MWFLSQIFSFCLLLTVLILCAVGYKRNSFYKGGFFMFLFFVLSNVYNVIRQIVLVPLLVRYSSGGIGFWIELNNLPSDLMNITGIIIFLVCLVRGLRRD